MARYCRGLILLADVIPSYDRLVSDGVDVD
jgi:hypothetical protein